MTFDKHTWWIVIIPVLLLITLITLDLAPLLVTIVAVIMTILAAVLTFKDPDVRLRWAFWMVLLAGCVGGYYCTFYIHYQPNEAFQFHGFPLPTVVLHLENNAWIDYVADHNAIMDLLLVPTLLALPVSIPLILRWRRRA